MDKVVCFKIDTKELYMEQVLVEFDRVPIYYICKDNEGSYYIVLCADIENEEYIIVNTRLTQIRNMLSQVITMRDIICIESNFWHISAKDDMDSDICKVEQMRDINKDVLPYENSYFKIVTDEHREYLDKINKELFLDEDWRTIDEKKKINNIYYDFQEEFEYDSIINSCLDYESKEQIEKKVYENNMEVVVAA